MNLWSIFFFNPIATKETNLFKKEIIKILKPYSPINYKFEELTSFLLLNTSFNTNLCSGEKINLDDVSIDEFSTNLLREIKDALGVSYNNYLNNLVGKFLKDIKRNRELKEAINIISNKFELENDKRERFFRNLYEAIENSAQNYYQVINDSTIFILDHHECENSIVEMGDIHFLIESKKNIVKLIDEMVLFNFSKIYVEKTNKILDEFTEILTKINDFLNKSKKKTIEFEEALNLLKGKSFEIVDNIHDMRRQIARQNRAEDAIKAEVKEIDNEQLRNIFVEGFQKEKLQEITKQTDKALQLLNDWFQITRNIELIEKYSVDLKISEKNIDNIQEFFIQMESLRVWSEFFYDISYFTVRRGKVVASLDITVRSEIETDAVLVVEDIYKTYRLPKTQVYALRGVSFEIKKGEFLAIMGPSGAGKTTLVNILTGLDSPDKGVIYLNGKNIALMDDKDLTEFRRDHVGLVFQFYQLFADLTAIENVSMPAEMANIPVIEAREKALEILKIVELEKFANQYPDKLSGGQQQRVAIARALINDPAIIVADQLTGDLDSVTGQQIIGYLRKINTEKGTTVLLVTHNKSVATQADRILTMDDGEIIEEIDMTALKREEMT